ncbi:MAG: single-stranded DNA-binding protein [Phycisphaeraceae bacterium]
MPNLNKVMLMGNLTRDPELRYTSNNTPVANLGLAVNRRWRNQQGEQQEETTFIDLEAWGRTAEVLNQYLRKGRPIYVEGRLKLDQWQDREGNNRSKLRVVVESFEFLDSGQGGGGGGGYNQPPQQQSGGGGGGGYNAPPQQQAPQSGGPHTEIPEDDIPF